MRRLVWLIWLQLWRGRVLPVCLLCGLLTAGASLWITVNANRVQQVAVARASTAEYGRWLAQGPKYAHAAAHYGMYAFRPVYGTGNIEPGVLPHAGQSVYLEAHTQDPAVYRADDDEAATLRVGDMSPAWVCRCVLPLLAVLLGAGSMAADRLPGTLRLNLVYSQSTRRLLASRMIAVATAPALLAAGTTAIACVAAHLFSMQEPAHSTLRWVVLALALVWPSVLWSILAIAVSSRFSHPAAALAACSALWLLSTVVVPRVSAQAAQVLFPPPSRQEISVQIRQATGEGEDTRTEEAFTRKTLERYGVQRIEDLPVSLDGLRREHAEEAGDRVFDQFWGNLYLQYARQQRLEDWLALLDPTVASARIAARIAESDLQAQVSFLHAAEEHRRLMQRILNEELARKRTASDGPRPISSAEVWKRVPPFHLQNSPQPSFFPGWLPLLGALLQGLVVLLYADFSSKSLVRSRI